MFLRFKQQVVKLRSLAIAKLSRSGIPVTGQPEKLTLLLYEHLGWLTGGTLLLLATMNSPVAAQVTLVEEEFRDSTAFGWLSGAGLNSRAACLTAGNASTPTNGSIPACSQGVPDVQGQGALRLTGAESNQSAFAFYNFPIPATFGLDITFNYFSYGGIEAGNPSSQADGLTFFIFDGDTISPQPGAFGGSLGYAQGNAAIGTSGLTRGFFGVGLDEYGNFSNDGQGRGTGCTVRSPRLGSDTAQNRVLDSITVRGSSLSRDDTTQGYCYLANSGNLTQITGNPANGIDVPNATNRDAAVRSVRILLTPDFQLSIYIDFTGRQVFPAQPTIGPINLRTFPNQRPNPQTFKFGFASATGTGTNIHEVRTLRIRTLLPAPAPDLTLQKTTNAPTFLAGGTGEYTLTVTNKGDGPTTDPIEVVDTLPPGFSLASAQPNNPGWSCTENPQGRVTCVYFGDPNSTNPATDPPIAPGESQRVVLRVNVPRTPGQSAVNTAVVTAAAEPPERRGDNTATTTTPIVDTVVSTKRGTLVDANNNGSADPGEAIVYTITITNVGNAPSTNTVFSDPIPEGTTYIPGTTKLNGTTVTDAAGNTMPFSGNGAPVNSNGAPAGQIDPSQSATVEFQVRINNPPGVTQISNQGRVTGPQIINPPVVTNPPTGVGTPGDNPSGPTITPIGPIGGTQPRLNLFKAITNVFRAGSPLPGINFNTPITDVPNASAFNNALSAVGIPFQGVTTIGSETTLRSGDEVEYTVYFLSDGSQPIPNTQVCDPIPTATTFIPDSFAPGNGILFNQGGVATALTNAADTDQGSFFSPLTPVSTPCPDTNNPNGSVLLRLGDLPNTTPSNTGFLRFRVRIN